jgi:hypothetical protein
MHLCPFMEIWRLLGFTFRVVVRHVTIAQGATERQACCCMDSLQCEKK